MKKNIAIKLKNLSKEFAAHNERIILFQTLNKEFEYGKMYGITGRSGCGKSTLIKLIGLLDQPTSGNIFIGNQDITSLSDDEQSLFRNKKIGFIFQNYLLDEYLNVFDNIILPCLISKDWKAKKSDVYKLAQKYQIDNRMKHYPKELSGGEQQRVAICRALINDPDIILADEPTGNLDSVNEKILFTELKKLTNSKKCVIVVSHSENIKNFVDEVINLEEGI